MADAPDPLNSPVPIECGVVSTEGHEGLPPAEGMIDHDDELPDDLDPSGRFSEWADDIDDADFADL